MGAIEYAIESLETQGSTIKRLRSSQSLDGRSQSRVES
jgi:hypothetical protein